MCERLGIDVWEVIDAAKTKPFGFMPFYPGPGLGGHCIPIDPLYLSWKARQTGFEARLIELAGQINSAMPHEVVRTITGALNHQRKPVNGSRVVVAGVTYKRDVSDIRESPALDIMGLLHQTGATSPTWTHSFRISGKTTGRRPRSTSQPFDRQTFRATDCVDPDRPYRLWQVVLENAPLIVDTRDAIKSRHAHVHRLGAPQPEGVVEPLAAVC